MPAYWERALMTDQILPGSLRVGGLSVSYGAHRVVTDASIAVPAGSMTALVGPNGAGKSTLLRAAMGLIHRDSGTVTVGDKPLARMRKEIAYVPQRGEVDWNFPITVEQTALLGTYPRLGILRRPNSAARATAAAALDQVGMFELRHRPIGQLSGGQQQRMFLARAIAQQARLILLDEPFTGVDVTSEKVIVAVLHRLRAAGAAILVVHHDLATLDEYFDQAIVLNNTVRAADKPAAVLQSAALREAYGLEIAPGSNLGP